MIAKINKTGIISDTIQKFDGEKFLTPTDFGFDEATNIPETLSNVIDAQALAETAALNAIEAKSNIEESVETIVEEATNEIQTVVSEIKEETLNAQSLAELAAVNAIETEQSIQARANEIVEEATTLAVNAKNLAEVAAVNALEAERNAIETEQSIQARANEIVEEATSQAINAKNLSETAAVNALEAERNSQIIKEELADFAESIKNNSRYVGEQWITFDGTVPDGGIPFHGQLVNKELYKSLYNWCDENNRLIDEENWQALYVSNKGNVPFYSYGDGHSATPQKTHLELSIDENYGLHISEITDSGISTLCPTFTLSRIINEIMEGDVVVGRVQETKHSMNITSIDALVSSINDNNELPFYVEVADNGDNGYVCSFIWKECGKLDNSATLIFEYQPYANAEGGSIAPTETLHKIFEGGTDAVESTYFRIPFFNGYFKADLVGGSYVQEGLPNITGRFNGKSLIDGSQVSEGALYYPETTDFSQPTPNTSTDSSQNGIGFDASLSNAIYGNSEHVTPETTTVIIGVYATGAIVENASNIDMEEVRNALSVANTYDSMPLLMSHWDKGGFVSPGWVKADAYWLSGDQYISAYNKILEKFNNGDEDVVEGIYSVAIPNTENPSKFIIDTTNRAFRLPFVSTERIVVKKIVDGKENCTIYSDGFCEQHGVSASGVGTSTVTFRVPFIDANYTVSIVVTEETATDTGGIASGLMISNITPESFRISQRTADIPYWSAKGMVAIIPPSQYTENVALYFKLGNVFVNEDQMDATAISNKVDEIRNAWADADYVVESYNDGTSWYRLYKSGWIEQGGECVGTSSGFQTITILPMRDTNYWVSTQRCGTTNNSNSAALAYQQAINLTTTSFQAYTNITSMTSTSTFRWFVAGYSA
jgi:hypothetical protein